MNVTETRCNECGRPPRRLSLMMDGRLFCCKDCWIAHCGRTWEQELAAKFGKHKPPNVIDMKAKGKK